MVENMPCYEVRFIIWESTIGGDILIFVLLSNNNLVVMFCSQTTIWWLRLSPASEHEQNQNQLSPAARYTQCNARSTIPIKSTTQPSDRRLPWTRKIPHKSRIRRRRARVSNHLCPQRSANIIHPAILPLRIPILTEREQDEVIGA